MRANEFLIEAANPEIAKFLKKLKYGTVEVSGNAIRVLIPIPEKVEKGAYRASILKKILEKLQTGLSNYKPFHNTDSSILAKSSIGIISFQKDPSFILVKDETKQGAGSSGVANELQLVALMQEKIDKFKSINVIFEDERGTKLPLEGVTDIEHSGKDSGRRTGGQDIRKADVVLVSANRRLPVSIKQVNAGFWESADTLFGKRGGEILKKLIDSGELEVTEGPPGNFNLPYAVVIEPTEEEAMKTLFGSDINPEGGIVIQDFQPHHFIERGPYIKIMCKAVIKTRDDIPESHLMVWRIRNAKGRSPLGIRGLRPEAATMKTALGLEFSRSVMLVDKDGNVSRYPDGYQPPGAKPAKQAAVKKPVQQKPVQPPGLTNKQKPMATSKVPMAQPKSTKPIIPVAPGITNQE
jgi:hypothetical protein